MGIALDDVTSDNDSLLETPAELISLNKTMNSTDSEYLSDVAMQINVTNIEDLDREAFHSTIKNIVEETTMSALSGEQIQLDIHDTEDDTDILPDTPEDT